MKRAYSSQGILQRPHSLYCSVCRISCPTELHFDAHIRGKKHQQNVQGDDYVPEKRFNGRGAGMNDDESIPIASSVATTNSTRQSGGEKWIIQSADGGYTCVICAVSFSDSGYDLHMKGGKHAQRMRGAAPSLFGDKFDLNTIKNMSTEYQVIVKNTVWCAICDVKTNSESIYNTHIISRDHLKRLKEMRNGRRLCTTCNLRFVKKSGLKRHLHCVLHGIKQQELVMHPLQQQPSSSAATAPTTLDFFCNFCCKTFPNEESIKIHYRDSGHDKLNGVPRYLKSKRERRQKGLHWERPATLSSADVFRGQQNVEAIDNVTYDEEYYEEDDGDVNNDGDVDDDPDSGDDNDYENNNEDGFHENSYAQPSQSMTSIQSTGSHNNADEYDDEQDEYYDDDDEEQEECGSRQPPSVPSPSDQRRLVVAGGASAVGLLRSVPHESAAATNNSDQADVDRYLAKNLPEFSSHTVNIHSLTSVPRTEKIYLGNGISVKISMGKEFEELSASSLIAIINEACIRKNTVYFDHYYKFLCAGCNFPVEDDNVLKIHLKSFRHGDFIKASLGKIQEQLRKHKVAMASALLPIPVTGGVTQMKIPSDVEMMSSLPGSMLLQTPHSNLVNIPNQATISSVSTVSTSGVVTTNISVPNSVSVNVYRNFLRDDVRKTALLETQKQLIRQCPLIDKETVERNAASYSTFNSRYLMPGVTTVPIGRLSFQEQMDVEANRTFHEAHRQLSADAEFLKLAGCAVERLELVLKNAYDKLARDQMTNSVLNRIQMAGPFRVGPFASNFMMKCDQKEPIILVMLCTKYPTELVFRDFYRRCCEEIEVDEDVCFTFKTRQVALESSIYVTFSPKIADLRCRVMFTSEQGFTNIQSSDRPLPWAHCQYALAEIRRVMWIETNKASLNFLENIVIVFRDICRRFDAWNGLSDWAVVLISVMSLNSYYTPCLRVSDGIKRTLEVVASGALTGITDPCDATGVTNALDEIGDGQAYENWIASAQHMVRLLAFNRVDAILGVSLLNNVASANGQEASTSSQQLAGDVRPSTLSSSIQSKSTGGNANREAKYEGNLEPTVVSQSTKLKPCKTEIILLD